MPIQKNLLKCVYCSHLDTIYIFDTSYNYELINKEEINIYVKCSNCKFFFSYAYSLDDENKKCCREEDLSVYDDFNYNFEGFILSVRCSSCGFNENFDYSFKSVEIEPENQL